MSVLDVVMFSAIALPIGLILWLVVIMLFKVLWDSFNE